MLAWALILPCVLFFVLSLRSTGPEALSLQRNGLLFVAGVVFWFLLAYSGRLLARTIETRLLRRARRQLYPDVVEAPEPKPAAERFSALLAIVGSVVFVIAGALEIASPPEGGLLEQPVEIILGASVVILLAARLLGLWADMSALRRSTRTSFRRADDSFC